MDIAEQQRSGRHRLDDDGAARRPPRGGPARPATAPRAIRLDELPLQRTRDPLADTDAAGLRKFDIGLVPASVTPPRTWRRAAWFAVLSSAAVLVGLAYAAAELVGVSAPAEPIGMPGYPSAAPVVPGPTATAPPYQAGLGVIGTPAARPDGLRSTAGRPARVAVAPAGTAAVPEPGPTPDEPPPPTVRTVPNAAAPLVDGAEMAARAERFYELLAAGGALSLVSDAFRGDAEALLERRFADVAEVRVSEVSVDPVRGVAVSTLHVTEQDGTRRTEKRELVFTTTGDLVIRDERPFAGA
ncbi:hypothetical protein [Saccharothrix australiensis]|uniref:Uncharacterized protein n=1 Tax=Saccharothrix australiensis TaxID=2072 RepID=A0A495W7L4_9PSEU|nr:hypothetical protein [Saccharothrix australiensis]RKT57662.1 hypothetical protein C8E97_6387 [Saccharothrix australiensis]